MPGLGEDGSRGEQRDGGEWEDEYGGGEDWGLGLASAKSRKDRRKVPRNFVDASIWKAVFIPFLGSRLWNVKGVYD